VVPIPGTRRRSCLEENVAASGVRRDDADLARLDRAFPPGITAGERDPAGQMKRVGLWSPSIAPSCRGAARAAGHGPTQFHLRARASHLERL
jgi:hypothetical protein